MRGQARLLGRFAGGVAAALLVVACGPDGAVAPGGSAGPPATTSDAEQTTPPTMTPTSTAPTTPPTPAVGTPDLAGRFDVGGHELAIECRGATGPVMVLETGSGSPGATWLRSDFITLLDQRYRRCIYDRANLGASDDVDTPRTSATAATELHALLHAAGLPGPYVLVGRSFGGYNVRLFASMYPDEVADLVLVESLTPEFHAGMKDLLDAMQWASEASFNKQVEWPLDIIASGPLVAAADLPDLPLLVIAATESHTGDPAWPEAWPAEALNDLWMEEQVTLAESVASGRLVVFEGGDHNLFLTEPKRLAEEINAFLAP